MEAALAQYRSHSLHEQNDVALMDRMDTKYALPEALLADCLRELTAHYSILEMEGSRQFWYDTLYFDTGALDFYHAHHNGKLNRHKVRLRHYLQSQRLFLEVKLKNNKYRTIKQRLELSTGSPESMDVADFLKATLSVSPEALSPSLFVSYNRMTLINRDRTERITLDRHIDFRSTRTLQKVALPGIAIVEVKTARKAGCSALSATLRDHEVQPLRLSKYCTGIALTQLESIKRNAFKPMLNQLDILQRRATHDRYA
jgi:hypothetical protein